MPVSNGKVTNGVTHLTNGSHPRAVPNSEESQESDPVLNGHHAGKQRRVSWQHIARLDSALASLTTRVSVHRMIRSWASFQELLETHQWLLGEFLME